VPTWEAIMMGLSNEYLPAKRPPGDHGLKEEGFRTVQLKRLMLFVLSVQPLVGSAQVDPTTPHGHLPINIVLIFLISICMVLMVTGWQSLTLLKRIVKRTQSTEIAQKAGTQQPIIPPKSRKTRATGRETLQQITTGSTAHIKYRPSFWKTMAYFVIAWIAVYVAVYHVFKMFPEKEIIAQIETTQPKILSAAQPVKVNKNEIAQEVVPTSPKTTNGKAIFKLRCITCHAADGGGGIGPNLTDAYWLHGDSYHDILQVIANGVPEKGMLPWKSVLSPAGIRDVAEFVTTLAGTSPAHPTGPEGVFSEQGPINIAKTNSMIDIQPKPNLKTGNVNLTDSVQIGRALFSGSLGLLKGGPPCITCHHVKEGKVANGGIIAPDLTNVYTRLGSAYIRSFMFTPKYPAMQEVYNRHPIAEVEAAYLIAYFKFAGTQSAYQERRDQRAAGFLDRVKKRE